MKKFLTVFTAFLLIFTFASMTTADTCRLKDQGPQSGLSIKDAGNKNAKMIDTMTTKDVATIVGQYGDYVKATSGDKSGYIWVKAMDMVTGIVTGQGARMVDAPKKAGNTVGSIKAGTKLDKYELVVTWYQVNITRGANTINGWICAEYVAVTAESIKNSTEK